MTTQAPPRPAQKGRSCSRCGGRLIRDVDALAHLMCGRRDYGPRFRPLGLDPVDARAAADALKTEAAAAGAESASEGSQGPAELLET